MLRQTHCPFADISRIAWFFDARGLAEWCRALDTFALEALADSSELDGILVTTTGGPELRSPHDLGRRLKHILTALGGGPTALGRPQAPEWWFDYLGESWFVLVFSALYGPHSPRTATDERFLHVFLQRESAFARHRVAGRIPLATRRGIRQRFARRGQAYAAEIAEHPLEAAKFVLPSEPTDPVVDWWT